MFHPSGVAEAEAGQAAAPGYQTSGDECPACRVCTNALLQAFCCGMNIPAELFDATFKTWGSSIRTHAAHGDIPFVEAGG